ncbi:hypothetical protein BDC45DRAFT_540306 [Circinella umbellata]|nr:hypothetical protein BDC45DRAFT_540306 [Circinella umbellata]
MRIINRVTQLFGDERKTTYNIKLEEFTYHIGSYVSLNSSKLKTVKLITTLYNSMRDKLFLMKVLEIRCLQLKAPVRKLYRTSRLDSKNSSNNVIIIMVVIIHQIASKTATKKPDDIPFDAV